MNKYLTFPGLQPVYLGDIDFLQESVRSAFSMLLVGLTGQQKPKAILKEATTDSDGIICFDGEILPLKPFSGAVSQTLCYRIETQYGGARTFKNGEDHDCYEDRYVVGYDGSMLNEYRKANFKNIADLLGRAASKPSTGSLKYENDDVFTKINYLNIGGSYSIFGHITATNDVSVEKLVDNAQTSLPIGSGYFPITLVNKGVMKIIPARLEVTSESLGVNRLTITISPTQLSMDDIGDFYLNNYGAITSL